MQLKLIKETASIKKRIAVLKQIVKEYYPLPDKALIERHTELLRCFDIRGSKHKDKHPHKMRRVYVSRMSLKHLVESRKAQLLPLDKILFLIDQAQ